MPSGPTSVSDIMSDFVSDVADEDTQGYAETQEPLVYCALRQKDLKDEKGKVLRPAGGYRFGSAKEPSSEDLPDLLGILMASAEIRTRFNDPSDTKPVCGSRDMIQADDFGYKERGYPRLCQECVFNRHGSKFNGNTTTHCRENLQYFFYELHRREVICFQMTPGGRKGWRDFSAKIRREFRMAFTRKHPGKEAPKEAPWITMILKLGSKWVDEKGGYYVPEFEVVGKLSPDQLLPMREQRKDMADTIEIMKASGARGGGMVAEDLMGTGPAPEAREVDSEVVQDDIPF